MSCPPRRVSPVRKVETINVLLTLLLFLSLAGLWVVGTEVHRLRESRMTTIERAVRVQRAGEFTAASVLWEQAMGEGHCKTTCLGEMAYCQFAAGHHDAALATCDILYRHDRFAHRTHYVRGMVFKARKDIPRARDEFLTALHKGEPLAANQLRKVN